MVTYIFLLHNNSGHIIHFNLTKFKNFYLTEKKILVKSGTKPLLWNVNYDRGNNDYTNALNPRCFKWCDYDIVPCTRHFLPV